MSKIVGVSFRQPEKAQPYLRALDEVGVGHLPLTPDNPAAAAELSGLLITGGGADINPALYGQEPAPETDGPPDEERDIMEIKLIKFALERNLPVLCICRGMQMLNIVHGGDLIQHIPEAGLHAVKPPPGRRHEIVHTVEVVPDSSLGRILGVAEHPVNSRHHQAVAHVGQYLRVSASAPDGVIEAIERPDLDFVIGCQWHPEESIRTNPGDRKIFEAFRDSL